VWVVALLALPSFGYATQIGLGWAIFLCVLSPKAAMPRYLPWSGFSLNFTNGNTAWVANIRLARKKLVRDKHSSLFWPQRQWWRKRNFSETDTWADFWQIDLEVTNWMIERFWMNDAKDWRNYCVLLVSGNNIEQKPVTLTDWCLCLNFDLK
jgi:hypothetical protein